MDTLTRRLRFLGVLVLGLLGSATGTWACTLWGAAGSSVDGGGTLVAKNRDRLPDNHQLLKTVRATSSHWAYFGLYAEDNDSPGFKAGINEKGLVVVNAVADQAVFRGKGPMFYLLGDGQTLAEVEVAVDGRVSVQTTVAGTLAHTNHYLDPAFASSNVRPGRSSEVRLGRIRDLLAAPRPWTLDGFWALTSDRHDGPHDSLWRSGTGQGERTLASWVVSEVPGRPPVVKVRLANPGEPVGEQTFVLDQGFWKG